MLPPNLGGQFCQFRFVFHEFRFVKLSSDPISRTTAGGGDRETDKSRTRHWSGRRNLAQLVVSYASVQPSAYRARRYGVRPPNGRLN